MSYQLFLLILSSIALLLVVTLCMHWAYLCFVLLTHVSKNHFGKSEQRILIKPQSRMLQLPWVFVNILTMYQYQYQYN